MVLHGSELLVHLKCCQPKYFFSNLIQIQMLIYRCSHTRIQTRIYEYTRTTLTLWTTSKDLSNRQIIISVKLPYPNSYQNKKLYCTYYYLWGHTTSTAAPTYCPAPSPSAARRLCRVTTVRVYSYMFPSRLQSSCLNSNWARGRKVGLRSTFSACFEEKSWARV